MDTGIFTPRPVRRFRLSLRGALLVSFILHVALVTWFQLAAPEGLLLVGVGEAGLAASAKVRNRANAPLHFTFVDVPDDEGVAENPQARLLSDKTRVARQPVPTPPDAKDLGPEPHSEGNSRLRQLPRPGPPVPPAKAAGSLGARAGAPRPPGESELPAAAGTAAEAPGSLEEERARGRDGEKGQRGKEQGFAEGDRRVAFQEALHQLQSGTYDFSGFDNSSFLQSGNYGTLSFDTKGFAWGDYARQIYLIIKKNWYDRIPIAAWYGQKGKVFIRFVIEKDGNITDLAVIRSSDISPLDRAAENAIRASHPLPPLPSTFPGEREGVTFGFYYNLPIDQP